MANTTSGTTTFDKTFSIDEIIEEAFERLGIQNVTGFKGFFPCNGVLGMSGGATTASTETADEVEAVVSGDPGASGVTMVLKFIGISSSSDAS